MRLSRQRRFPRARSSVGAARAFALETLREWGWFDRHDDVRLCVSELAGNAVLHGVPPGREYCLELDVDGPSLRIGVRDSGGEWPTVGRGDSDACRGRGLRLVAALADDFGVTPHSVGKTVWALFRLTTTQPEGDASLPGLPMTAAASWLLVQETLPRHETVKLLGADFGNHLERVIPHIERLAAGCDQTDVRALVALEATVEARRMLDLAECAGLSGEVERVKRLARSVMALRDHSDVLMGVTPSGPAHAPSQLPR